MFELNFRMEEGDLEAKSEIKSETLIPKSNSAGIISNL